MSRVEIMVEMKRMIEENPSLAISEWQGTCKYVVGEMISLEVKDLQEMHVKGVKPGENQVMPIELMFAAAANSFGLLFHLEAYNEGIIVDSAEVIFNGTVNKAKFLGIQSGNSGITKPMITLKVTSAANKGKLSEIAAIAAERSPILSSLNERVTLHIL
ncbi:OsmC family protein [Sporosarcina sp.]|uniref:OsmC family protein n=1 Tax=Sporosarcina sp. TaxID=49982 RepID=UPI00262840BF|nr:OsmC family protein [Sporosarcina sp.]